MIKKSVLFLSLLLLALSTGCSRLDLALKSADMLVAFKVDDYFDIDSRQKRDLKKQLNRDMAKLRKQKFPEVVGKLRNLSDDLSSSEDEAVLADVIQYSLGISTQLRARFMPTTEIFIESLRPAQIQHFAKMTAKKLTEEKRSLRHETTLLRQGRKSYERWIEFFVGRLSPQQKQLLDQHILKTTYFKESRIRSKERLLQKISQTSSQEEQKDLLKDLYYEIFSQKVSSAEEVQERFFSDLQDFAAALLKSLDTPQKERLKTKLRDTARQLESLAS